MRDDKAFPGRSDWAEPGLTKREWLAARLFVAFSEHSFESAEIAAKAAIEAADLFFDILEKS